MEQGLRLVILIVGAILLYVMLSKNNVSILPKMVGGAEETVAPVKPVVTNVPVVTTDNTLTTDNTVTLEDAQSVRKKQLDELKDLQVTSAPVENPIVNTEQLKVTNTTADNVVPSNQDKLYHKLGDESKLTNMSPEQAAKMVNDNQLEKLLNQELLPKSGENNSKWMELNPEGDGSLKNVNLLDAGHHFGINTVGQTLRNANRQIRSEPANPQVQVSPWLQSTIEHDANRKPLEIGTEV